MTTALGGSVELLGRSLDYTRDRLERVHSGLLDRPTPCAGWRLDDLLTHMEDALDAFTEAAGGAVVVRAGARGVGQVAVLREKGCALLGAWHRPAPGDVVIEAVADRVDLVSPLLVATAALEVTVHGWDVGQSTGDGAPIPEDLAGELLPVAHRVVGPGDRGTRFAAARPVASDASYDVRLRAFLGRA